MRAARNPRYARMDDYSAVISAPAIPLVPAVIPAKAGIQSPQPSQPLETNPKSQPTYPFSLDGRRLG